jgi:hypothetical protein
MLSRISIDIDENNNPLVLLAVETKSDDLRDKIANRFTKDFEEGSVLCKVEHTGLDRQNRMVWEIKPISAAERYLTPKEVIKIIHKIKSDPGLQKVSSEDLLKKYL